MVGIALMVERWYDGCAFALGEGDKHTLGGSLIGGGGICSSRGSGGDVSRFVEDSNGVWAAPIPIELSRPERWSTLGDGGALI